MADAPDLVRVARGADGRLRAGPGPGRGAWLHPRSACIEQAAKRGGFGRALKAPVSPEAIAELRVALGL